MLFAELGLPNPNEQRAKAELASRIDQVIRQRRICWASASPRVSRSMRGQIMNFSVERLMHFLTLLGRDVAIVIKRVARSRRAGQVRVVEAG